MLRLSLSFVVVSLLAMSCARPVKPPTASSARQSARSGAQSLKSNKPAQAMQTTQAPRATPAPKSAGGTTVTPRDITRGGTVSIETWTFDDVDLDGDDVGESGLVAVAGDDVAAWWSGAFFLEEDGSTVPYEAMLWTEGGGVGVIYDFGEGAIACGADASGATSCIVCDVSGECSVE
jgi:hypothetical protein